MRDAVPAFRAHLASRCRAPRTQATYASIIEAFFALRDVDPTVHIPSRTDVEAFLGRAREDGAPRAPGTRNQELAALRAFAAFARRDLGWVEDPTEGIAFVKETPRDPPVLSVFEIRRLFSLVSTSSRGWQRVRDVGVLALLSQLGLRVHELVGLNVGQLDVATATLIGVDGKGGSRHDLPLNPQTLALLQTWLETRPAQAHPDERALFVSARGRRMSIRSVERFIERLRELSGTRKRITPHTLRHSAATVALTLGIDVSTVAELLRHADLNTTRKYLHLVDERRREAVRRLALAIPPEILPGTRAVLDLSSATKEPPPSPDIALDLVRLPPNIQQKNAPVSTARPLDAQGDLDDMAEAA